MTCSPRCARAREKRLLREKYGPGSSYHGRVLRKLRSRKRARREAWRCAECGCIFDAAVAKRRQLGEKPITTTRTVTCSLKCQQRHRFAAITRWQREHPELRKEHQRRIYARVARGA